jgi:hypothetical protein
MERVHAAISNARLIGESVAQGKQARTQANHAATVQAEQKEAEEEIHV